jgi:ABC-type spermidine/putrescine transport system permease subunit I
MTIEFAVKLVVDFACWILKISGLTNSLILSEQGKLRRTFHSTIAAILVLVYFIVCTAIFTLFFVMIAIDIKKLQQASLGLFKLDRVAGFVDLSQFEKTFFEQFQNSFDLLEN